MEGDPEGLTQVIQFKRQLSMTPTKLLDKKKKKKEISENVLAKFSGIQKSSNSEPKTREVMFDLTSDIERKCVIICDVYRNMVSILVAN